MEKTIFEKRFEINLKIYKKIGIEKLCLIEQNKTITLYNAIHLDEVLITGLVSIFNSVKNEMEQKIIVNENTTEYKIFLDIIEKIISKVEKINIDDYGLEIMKILTILQLSQNIQPSFPTMILQIQENKLYEQLNNFINNNQKVMKGEKWEN